MYDTVHDDIKSQQNPVIKVEEPMGSDYANMATISGSPSNQTSPQLQAKISTLPPAEVYNPNYGGTTPDASIQYAQIDVTKKKKKEQKSEGEGSPPPLPPPLPPLSTPCYDEVVIERNPPQVKNETSEGYDKLNHSGRRRTADFSTTQLSALICDGTYDTIIEQKSATLGPRITLAPTFHGQQRSIDPSKKEFTSHSFTESLPPALKGVSPLPTYVPQLNSFATAEPEYDIVPV